MTWRQIGLIAIAAAVAIVGGGAVASADIPDSNGVIHGCYHHVSGALRVYDTGNQSPNSCKPASETSVDWNATGPQGPAGPPGPKGEDGAQGPPGSPGGLSDAWFIHRSRQNPVSVPHSGIATVLTVDLPAGNYLLNAGVILTEKLDPNTSTVIDCVITVDGTALSEGITSVVFGLVFEMVSLTATASLPDPGTASVDCVDSHTDLKVDASGSLTVAAVGALH